MKSSSILVVGEDSQSLKQSLCELLESEGYQPMPASDADEALDLIREGARPQCILLDVLMPRLTGTEFFEARRREPALSSLPLVVLSTSDLPNVLPPDATISNPCDLDALLRTIAEFAQPTAAAGANASA
jgi:CheY-like chemotaxis protein